MNKIFDIFRLISLTILFFFNLICYISLPEYFSNKLYYLSVRTFVNSVFFNTKINLIGKKDLITEKGCILISNHQNTQDLPIIVSKFNNTYGVAKSNICSDDTLPSYLKFTSYLENYIIKCYRCIPYNRGDRDSGVLVKKEIINLINENKNVLVFPEGKCRKSGVVEEFKSGLFRLAADNNIPIIPITLNYKRPIGLESYENIQPLDWFSNEVDMFIHPIQKNEDWEILKEDCYNLVKNPYL